MLEEAAKALVADDGAFGRCPGSFQGDIAQPLMRPLLEVEPGTVHLGFITITSCVINVPCHRSTVGRAGPRSQRPLRPYAILIPSRHGRGRFPRRAPAMPRTVRRCRWTEAAC